MIVARVGPLRSPKSCYTRKESITVVLVSGTHDSRSRRQLVGAVVYELEVVSFKVESKIVLCIEKVCNATSYNYYLIMILYIIVTCQMPRSTTAKNAQYICAVTLPKWNYFNFYCFEKILLHCLTTCSEECLLERSICSVVSLKNVLLQVSCSIALMF